MFFGSDCRIRIAVILSSLIGGGMERMRIHLIEEWAARGIEVDLVVGRFEGPLCALVPENVCVFEIARRHPLLFPFGLRRYFRRRQPTHILSAGHDVNTLTLLALRKLSHLIPIVISFHAHPSIQVRNAYALKRLKLRVSHCILRRFICHTKTIIAVSEGVERDLKVFWNMPNLPVRVIYNPTITQRTLKALTDPRQEYPVPTGTPWLVFVGRLDYQKGLDTLLEAFRYIVSATSAHLVIIGTGPLEAAILQETREPEFGGRVHIVGFQPNPLPWIRDADLLVLPSRFEGLPNVLIEALACGTQIVSTDCPSGPREILDNGRYGQLVPVENPETMSQAILMGLSGDYYVNPSELKQRAKLFIVERAADQYYHAITGGAVKAQD